MTEPAEARPQLPDFTNPPVIEVALSVAFQPLDGYTTAHSGLFWHRVADRFPRAQQQPPLTIPAEHESTKPPDEVPAEAPFQLLDLPQPRIWLVTEDDSELIQLQGDTFAQNWRKSRPEQPYPRYEHVLKRFEDGFRSFATFTEEQQLGSPKPLRCEVTYVNHVLSGDVWQDFSELHKVLSACSSLKGTTFLPEPDESRFSAKFSMRDRNGQFVGRLTVSAKPAFRRSDKHPLFILTLTARGKPVGTGAEGVLTFFDIGREWIVQGFADLTTRDMHMLWGRTE